MTSVELARQWGTAPAGLGSAIADAKRLHQELLDWARRDDELRRWIVGSWREAHAEVVAAADQAVIEGLLGDAVRLLNAFPLQETLLALLTDEFDDGRKLARTFVSQIEDDCERRELSGVLNCLLGENSDLSPRRVRVVILGGHQRDESKLADRLFENSPFEVRWRTFEKRAGSGLVQKSVVSLLRNADGLLIITGMASHMLAQFAKDFAQRNGILWKCIEKATDSQLKAALREMFPELSVDWA